MTAVTVLVRARAEPVLVVPPATPVALVAPVAVVAAALWLILVEGGRGSAVFSSLRWALAGLGLAFAALPYENVTLDTLYPYGTPPGR